MRRFALFLLLCSFFSVVVACVGNEDGVTTQSPTSATDAEDDSGSGATTASPFESGDLPNDASTSEDPDTTGGSTSGGSSATSGSDTDSDTDGTDTTKPDPQGCQDYAVFCADLFGPCPDGGDDNTPLTNQALIDFFRLHFIDEQLVPCYQGNPDDSEELAEFLRVSDGKLEMRALANFCLLNTLNERYNQLHNNPAQIAILPDLPDGFIVKGEEEHITLFYEICATGSGNKLTSVTLQNDIGMGPEAPEAISTARVYCSQGPIQPTPASAPILFEKPEITISDLGCFVQNEDKGKLNIYVVTPKSGEFRIGIIDAEGAVVLGQKTFPTYTVQ